MADDNDRNDELKYTDVGLRADDTRAVQSEEGIENPQGRFVGELERKYEATDVALKPILTTAGVVIAMLLGSYVILYGMFLFWGARAERNAKPELPIQAEQLPMVQGERLQPFPDTTVYPEYGRNVQDTEFNDYVKYKQVESKQLTESGWVDESKGVAKIPIDQAIDIVAAKGLPAGESWQMRPGTVMVQGVVMTSAEAAAQQAALKAYAQRQGMDPNAAPATPATTANQATQAPAATPAPSTPTPAPATPPRAAAAGAGAGTTQGRP